MGLNCLHVVGCSPFELKYMSSLFSDFTYHITGFPFLKRDRIISLYFFNSWPNCINLEE